MWQHITDSRSFKNADEHSGVCVELSSLCEVDNTPKPTAQVKLKDSCPCGHNVMIPFMDFTITQKSSGAFLVQESHQGPHGFALPKDGYVCKNVNLPFRGPFPWIPKIGVPCHLSMSMTLHCE